MAEETERRRDYFIPFDGAPKTPRMGADKEVFWVREIHLARKTIFSADGFGEAWSIYPVTVVPARFGSIEGGSWLCFPTAPDKLSTERFWDGWRETFIECYPFWKRAEREEWPIGRGPDPSAAYCDLVVRVCKLAGVEPDVAA